MIGRLEAARALASQYGELLRWLRTDNELTLNDLAALVSIDAPYLSLMERGRYLPTADEAERIATWAAVTPAGAEATELHVLTDPGIVHGRMGDPVSSDITVQSIADDLSLADKILICARGFTSDDYGIYVPFDDTDLVEALQELWPRPIEQPWQRNVVARARGLIGTELRLIRPCNPLDTRTERVRSPDCPLQHAGLIERTRHGRTRPTIHHIYVEHHAADARSETHR